MILLYLLCISKYFIMENKYIQDIAAIKNMMHKSSQFISLSGLAGVLAGIYALVGAFWAKMVYVSYFENHSYQEVQKSRVAFGLDQDNLVRNIFFIAVVVLFCSILTAFILTYFKAKKHNESILNPTAQRLAINFLIPLATGGIFALLMLEQQNFGLIGAVTLIFYGLACVNASKYTFRDVRYLGITMTILGLIATAFSDFSLQIWAFGFGFCHIVYGGLMYFKYDR
jgi:tRNA threonylcarbamoyladenosine modification (KEOPS) complex  Pcc1 subunit